MTCYWLVRHLCVKVKYDNRTRHTHPEVCDTVRSESWDWRESITSLCVEEAESGALVSVLLVMSANGLISCGVSPGSSLTSAIKM